MPDVTYVNDPDTGPFTSMYDATGTLRKVKDHMVSNRRMQGWNAVLPTITVTGTAITGGVLEAAIVTGGETLIFTIENGQWDSDVVATLEAGTFSGVLDGDASGAGSFDDEIGTLTPDGEFVRTSNTVLTLTTPAAAGYSISADEAVTFNIPYSLLSVNGIPFTGSGNVVCSPTTFDITNGA